LAALGFEFRALHLLDGALSVLFALVVFDIGSPFCPGWITLGFLHHYAQLFLLRWV
jgi:hypothetical protein